MKSNPPDPRQARGDRLFRRFWLGGLFMLLTPALMILAFEPYACWPLIFVALVPWTIGLCRLERRGLAYLAALVTFALMLYALTWWLAYVTVPGHLATAVLQTLYLVPVVIAIRYLYDRTPLPMLLILPLMWTAGEYFRGLGLTAFPWFYLGHALYRQLWAIQVCDLGGVYVLSFAVAMVNGLVVDLVQARWFTGPTSQGVGSQPSGDREIGGSADIEKEPAACSTDQITRSPDRPTNPSAIGNRQSAMSAPTGSGASGKKQLQVGVVIAVWLAIALYGWYRLDESKSTMTPGPTVAVIQDDLPMAVESGMDVGQDQMLLNMIKLSKLAAAHTPPPDLIAWPESMVVTNINPEFLQARLDAPLVEALLYPEVKDFLKHQPDRMLRFAQSKLQDKAREHAQMIADLCDQLGVPLLVGITAVVPLPAGGPAVLQRFNSTLLVAPQAGILPGRHDKLRCVPIGETVPFRNTWFHWLYRLINDYATPFGVGGYDYSLDEGTTLQIFALPATAAPATRPASQPGPSTASGPAVFFPAFDSPAPATQPGAGRPSDFTQKSKTIKTPSSSPSQPPTTKPHGFRFATPICFESTFAPYLCLWAGPRPSGKGVDFLINVSNDGWFLRSSELLQHLMICSFRAVEGRVGVARAVNTGISAFIKPTGEIYGYVRQNPRDPASPYWTGQGTPEAALCGEREKLLTEQDKLFELPDRQAPQVKAAFADLQQRIDDLTTRITRLRSAAGVRGLSVQPVYVDSRQTLYSRVGDVFAGILLVLLLAIQFAAWRGWVAERARRRGADH